MEPLLISLFLIIAVAFASIAATLGVDSRDGSDDPHRSAYPVSIA